MKNFSNVNLNHIIEFYHLHIFPLIFYKETMPQFDTYIHVYGWNMSILWSPFKIWMPKDFIIANFRHPLSKSELRPWSNWHASFQIFSQLWCTLEGITKIVPSCWYPGTISSQGIITDLNKIGVIFTKNVSWHGIPFAIQTKTLYIKQRNNYGL